MWDLFLCWHAWWETELVSEILSKQTSTVSKLDSVLVQSLSRTGSNYRLLLGNEAGLKIPRQRDESSQVLQLNVHLN